MPYASQEREQLERARRQGGPRERERRHTGCRQESEVYSNVLMHVHFDARSLSFALSRSIFISLADFVLHLQ